VSDYNRTADEDGPRYFRYHTIYHCECPTAGVNRDWLKLSLVSVETDRNSSTGKKGLVMQEIPADLEYAFWKQTHDQRDEFIASNIARLAVEDFVPARVRPLGTPV
jgi:hypothetical protein